MMTTVMKHIAKMLALYKTKYLFDPILYYKKTPQNDSNTINKAITYRQ